MAKLRRDADGDYALVIVQHIVRDTDGPWLSPGYCMLSFTHIPNGLWWEPRHTLKTLDPWFSEVARGLKTAELRKNDRDFKIGDVIRLSRVASAA